MDMNQPLEIMLDHDVWATGQILDACESLTAEQFSRRFEIGPGTLQKTTTHIIGAMRRWTDSLAGRAIRPRIEQDGHEYSVVELRDLLKAAAADFRQQIQDQPMNRIVEREFSGKTYQFTHAAVVAQLLTHGMHHRAQCLNMLRHLGVAQLPKSSVWEWVVSQQRG